MSMYLPVLLEWLRQYGMPILCAAIILQTNGIPVGANFLVMAAGAFAFAGEYDVILLVVSVWLFLLIGDVSSYLLWKYLGSAACIRFPRLQHSLQPRLRKAGRLFERYGAAAVVFTRFPVSVLSIAINIVSGTTSFHFPRFILAAAVGETMWAGFNVSLGYWFGDSWQDISSLVPAAGQWFALLFILAAVVYLIKHNLRQRS
mgnify:CR=1 FL=1